MKIFSATLALLAVFTIVSVAHRSTSASTSASLPMDAAFRDGVYLGDLAASRGETPHISGGRWATINDRQSFTAGYKEGYSSRLIRASLDSRSASDAFQDGLSQGRLDADQGRPMQAGSNRWSRLEEKASFNNGYRQAYEEISLAHQQWNATIQKASLVRSY